jgi:hypothetical protein
MTRLADLPEHQEQIRAERAQAQAMAKVFVEACQSGDVDQFRGAGQLLVDNIHANWTTVFRQVAHLHNVSESIRDAFQLLWVESRLASHCVCNDAQLDALRVLLKPYKGSSVRLFRGARAREARARKFYGVCWSSDIEEADRFARRKQDTSSGAVVLETIAQPEAIISAPGIDGAYYEDADGERLFDEREYIVDGRRLQRVTVARRYPKISSEEWKKILQSELSASN